MQFYGTRPDGTPGLLTEAQAVEMIEALDTRRYDKTLRNTLGTVVNGITSEPNAPGGGNTTYAFEGLPMHHESHNVGENQGVTVFYTKQANGFVKVIGIGYHTGAQTYKLLWKIAGWQDATKQLSLDKKLQGKQIGGVKPQPSKSGRK